MLRHALGSDVLATRMLACRQLYFFMAFHGTEDGDGGVVDALGLFEQALEDPDRTVQGQALAQLRSLCSAKTRPLLERCADRVDDDYLGARAREILDDLPPV